MQYATQIKPISYVEANAAQVLRDLSEKQDVRIVTQNGEATAALHDISTHQADQQALVLLKILALGNQQIENRKVISTEMPTLAFEPNARFAAQKLRVNDDPL